VAQLVRINGPDDPRVEPYRSVPDAERLRSDGLFVAEGRFVVQRLIESGRFRVRSLLLNDAAWRALEPVCERLGPDVEVYLGSPRDFLNLTGYNVHRGCLALAERPRPILLDDVLSTARKVVALDHVANADNVGGVFRNAAAFGADGVVLSHGCADPLYRKAIRTSMAATLRVPFSTAPADGWGAALMRLRASGFHVVALTLDESAQELDGFARSARPDRIALLLGAEGEGLSLESQEAADVRVRIAIRPDVDSLNVAVAAGIALHRLARGPSVV
jgi:tRNA G18 (ribose-2'-O)-methylase SpoU